MLALLPQISLQCKQYKQELKVPLLEIEPKTLQLSETQVQIETTCVEVEEAQVFCQKCGSLALCMALLLSQ